MKYRFCDIVETFPVRRPVKALFDTAFLALYSNVEETFRNTRQYKQSTVSKVNYLLYVLYTDKRVPYGWEEIVQDPDFSCPVTGRDLLGTLRNDMLSLSDVTWEGLVDHTQTDVSSGCTTSNNVDTDNYETSSMVGSFKVVHTGDPKSVDTVSTEQAVTEVKSRTDVPHSNVPLTQHKEPTPKEDLFIVTPKYPRVGDVDSRYGNVHVSLPRVPLRQSEVSCTTDPDKLTNSELLNLYPNRLVQTRSPLMYEPKENITLDPDFGLLVPVDGFTDAQVRDCIIRYPHIFKLKRIGPDGVPQSFYSHIEIDGELVDTLEAWSFLPEAKLFDFDSMETRQEQIEFMKEYAIRRYLLERDVKGIKHKYEVVGDLPEFVTLFMPASMYRREGYGDSVELARQCVRARVQYLVSRNPRIGKSVTVESCPFDSYCTLPLCDRSCPRWAQVDYLLMRNGLSLNSRPFKTKLSVLEKYDELYQNRVGRSTVVTTSDTNKCAESLSYVSVFNNWDKSAMRVKCYHLVFSRYVDALQASWSSSKSDELQYEELWVKSCNVLVVSGIDYVNFKDFQCQLLLQLLQDREREGKTTFVVSPKVEKLSGSGGMFNLLVDKFKHISRPLD